MVGYAPQGNPLYPANPDTADLSWLVEQPGSPLAPQDPGWTYGQVLPLAEQDDSQGNPHYKWAWPGAVRSLAQGVVDLARGAHGDTGGTITPEAENALLAYAMRGLGRGDPNELGIFAGKGAKNPPPEGSPLWSTGADDLPRFEINDAPAKTYIPSTDQLAALHQMPEGEAMMAYAPRILNHPELFSQYPELAQWKVGYGNLPPGYKAVTLQGDKQIVMNPWANQDLSPGAQFDTSGVRSQQDLTESLLHEFQHAVQQREGFARGSNPAMAQKDLYDIANDPNAMRLMSTNEKANLLQMAQDPYTAYNNAAGEVEARNVSRRYRIQQDSRMPPGGKDLPLSARGISPAATEDVPRKQQFLYPSLQPVEHNPYMPPSPTNPHPVDYDPFQAQASGPPMGKPMVGQPNRPLAPPKRRPQPVPQQTPNPQFEELPPDYKWPWEK